MKKENKELQSIEDAVTQYFDNQWADEHQPREDVQLRWAWHIWRKRAGKRRLWFLGTVSLVQLVICIMLDAYANPEGFGVLLFGQPLTAWALLSFVIAVIYGIAFGIRVSELDKNDRYESTFTQLEADYADYKDSFGCYPDELGVLIEMETALGKLAKRVDAHKVTRQHFKNQYDLAKKFVGRYSMQSYDYFFPKKA